MRKRIQKRVDCFPAISVEFQLVENRPESLLGSGKNLIGVSLQEAADAEAGTDKDTRLIGAQPPYGIRLVFLVD